MDSNDAHGSGAMGVNVLKTKLALPLPTITGAGIQCVALCMNNYCWPMARTQV